MNDSVCPFRATNRCSNRDVGFCEYHLRVVFGIIITDLPATTDDGATTVTIATTNIRAKRLVPFALHVDHGRRGALRAAIAAQGNIGEILCISSLNEIQGIMSMYAARLDEAGMNANEKEICLKVLISLYSNGKSQTFSFCNDVDVCGSFSPAVLEVFARHFGDMRILCHFSNPEEVIAIPIRKLPPLYQGILYPLEPSISIGRDANNNGIYDTLLPTFRWIYESRGLVRTSDSPFYFDTGNSMATNIVYSGVLRSGQMFNQRYAKRQSPRSYQSISTAAPGFCQQPG